MEEKKLVAKEICDLKHYSIIKEIRALEKNVVEIMKRGQQVSDLKHVGHKEALHASIISMRKDFERGSIEFKKVNSELSKAKDEYLELKLNETRQEEQFKTEQTKLKRLYSYVYGMIAIIAIHFLNKGDYSKTIESVKKILGG